MIRVCGYYSATRCHGPDTLARMLGKLRHRTSWQCRTWDSGGLHIGAVGPDDSRWVHVPADGLGPEMWLFGRVYGEDPAGEPASAEELRARFAKRGRGSLAGLNGSYVALVIAPGGTLIWETDYAAAQPLYYYLDEKAQTLYFASESKAFLGVRSFPRQADDRAVAYLLSLGWVESEETLYRDVRRSMPHSSYAYDGHEVRHTVHNTVSYEPVAMKELDAVDGFYHALTVSVRDRVRHARRVFLPLSAGLDSRLLLGVLQHEAREAGVGVRCCTFGRRECYDYVHGAELARTAGFEHVPVELRPDSMGRFLAVGTWLLEGLGNCSNLHPAVLCRPFAEFGGTSLSGVYGNLVSGSRFLLADGVRLDGSSYVDALLARIKARPSAFPQDELRRIGRPGLVASLSYPWEAMRQAFESAPAGPNTKKCGYLQLLHMECPRPFLLLSLSGDVEMPFADLRVVQHAMQMAPELWRSQRAYRQMIIRHCPRLARIPTSSRGTPVLASTTAWRVLGMLRIGARLRPKDSLSRYALYDEWLAGASRSVLDVVLAGADYLDPYVDPRAAVRLVEDALANRDRRKDYFKTVCVLATLVAWQRLFIDQSWQVDTEQVEATLGLNSSPVAASVGADRR